MYIDNKEIQVWNLILAVCYQLNQLKKATWKKFRLERVSNPWPYDTGAMLYILSYKSHGQMVNCEYVIYLMIVKYMNMNINYENHVCGLWTKHKWNLILAVCYHLKQWKKQPEKNSGLNRIDHLTMWLGSSVDRALHQYCKVMGLNSI